MRALLSIGISFELVENFGSGLIDSNVVLEVFLIDMAFFDGIFKDIHIISLDELFELSGLLNREILVNDSMLSSHLSNMVGGLSCSLEGFVTFTFTRIGTLQLSCRTVGHIKRGCAAHRNQALQYITKTTYQR